MASMLANEFIAVQSVLTRRRFVSACVSGTLAATTVSADGVRPAVRSVVIDAHAHFGYLGIYGQRTVPIDEILGAADEAGIQKLCISSVEATDFDMYGGNRATYELTKRYPDRIIGFATLPSSHFGQKGLDEIRRAVEQYGMRGVGELETGVYDPLDIPGWIAIIEQAARFRVPVLAHASPAACVGAAKRVPEASILMAHLGSGLGRGIDDWIQGIELAKSCSNVYVETCTSITAYGQIEMAVHELGPERVIFGTDTPLLDPDVQKAKITSADIPESAKELILGENMRRLLGLAPVKQ